jgi:hypothetical protein
MKRTLNIKCKVDGCNEWKHVETENQKEHAELYRKYYKEWLCTRHSNVDELLTALNRKTVTTIIASKSIKYPHLTELFWGDRSGFIYGTGYKAFANDFPEGTKLIVTAEIVLPPL